jgi:hypothetical protein
MAKNEKSIKNDEKHKKIVLFLFSKYFANRR